MRIGSKWKLKNGGMNVNELNLSKISKDDLRGILEKHKKWLNGEDCGEKADLRNVDFLNFDLQGVDLRGSDLQGSDLQGSDLQGSNLRWSNLRWSNLRWSNLQGSNLQGSNLQGSDLQGSNLQGSDLQGSNLRGSNLRGADIDFSCWPLWCGSLDVTVDKRIAAQLAYHFCRLVCDDDEVKQAQKMLAPLADQFHRAEECGRIEE